MGEQNILYFSQTVVTVKLEALVDCITNLWFRRASLNDELIAIQRFHVNQDSPDSERDRLGVAPYHQYLASLHKYAEQTFIDMASFLGRIRTALDSINMDYDSPILLI